MADFMTQFLPPVLAGPMPHPPPPAPRPTGLAARDPERTPEWTAARDLGRFGGDLLDSIHKDYVEQRKKWEDNIDFVTDQFLTAMQNQEKTMKEVDDARRAAAELNMFIFSLITSGVMGWAGAFISSKVYAAMMPKVLSKEFISVTAKDWPENVSRLLQVSKVDYSKAMTSFIEGPSGILTGKLQEVIVKEANEYNIDATKLPGSDALARKTKEALKHVLRGATGVVIAHLKDAIEEMKTAPVPNFGLKWGAYAKGNKTQAMAAIRQRMQEVRDRWARESPYFGLDPQVKSPNGLIRAFERGLWSAWINGYMTDFFGKKSITPEKMLAMAHEPAPSALYLLWNSSDEHAKSAWLTSDFAIDGIIIDKLEELNVVVGQTAALKKEQKKQTKTEGETAAHVRIDGDMDDGSSQEICTEMHLLWDWARNHPGTAAQEVKRVARQGTPRQLKPLGISSVQ